MRALPLWCGLLAACIAAGCSSDPEESPPPGSDDAGPLPDGASDAGADAPPAWCDPETAQAWTKTHALTSCALGCSAACGEAAKPATCPALAGWDTLPHDCAATACGDWDGTRPPVVQGRCEASVPSGEAIAKTTSTGTPVVLPDGRRLHPAGHDVVFDDALQGTFPAHALWLRGTPFIAVSDVGYDDNALRIVDARKLALGQQAVASQIVYARPESLNYGLAVGASGTLYAASGAHESVVRAYAVDAEGQVTHTPALDVPVGNAASGDAFPSGIAVSPDGHRLAVAQERDSSLLVYSLDEGTYAQKLFDVDLGGGALDLFAAAFDPASSDVVYVTERNGARLVEVDLAQSPPGVRKIATGHQPTEMAFVSATHVVVASSLSDQLEVVDRASATVVATVAVGSGSTVHGMGPSALAYDAGAGKLYVTLADRNGVEVFDVASTAGNAPTLTSRGVIPTAWWPTAVVAVDSADDDSFAGSLVVLAGKGHGTGPVNEQGGNLCCGLIGGLMRGSAQVVQPADQADLAALTATWQADGDASARVGVSVVSCAEDAPYDFPVPQTNTGGPSTKIDHVVFLVRENKTYDAVLGDLTTGGADGDASLVMAPGRMDALWPNVRAIAKTFAHADNFYDDAEQSIQGHFWTVFGRSSDYTERTWLSTWGRATRGIPDQGVVGATQPVEGSLFSWLEAGGVSATNMGELIGGASLDSGFGIVSTSGAKPDTIGACYLAGRARVACDLPAFTYAWLVNDHTMGGAAGRPNPALMIAVGDEATGMILDAVSHSPLWKSTLVVIIEDDPQDGADHVDAHRSLAVLASPWIKRGYVSHTHTDVASLHKLFAHLFGLPYRNAEVRDAPLPYDLFTSTPDYTPFAYVPRAFADLSCNSATTAEAQEAASRQWDFSEPDDQPGLSAQVWRMLRAGTR